MSEQEKQVIKRQFRTAQKLIAAQRYDAARHVLQQIDHPQAQVWLQKIAGKTSKTTSVAPVSGMMILFGVIAVMVVLGLILALIYAPPFIEALQARTEARYLDETYVSADEILYANVAGYCYHITGYGGELCLDWTDLLMAEYHDIVADCFDPYMDIAVVDYADFAPVADCLLEGGVPNPL